MLKGKANGAQVAPWAPPRSLLGDRARSSQIPGWCALVFGLNSCLQTGGTCLQTGDVPPDWGTCLQTGGRASSYLHPTVNPSI